MPVLTSVPVGVTSWPLSVRLPVRRGTSAGVAVESKPTPMPAARIACPLLVVIAPALVTFGAAISTKPPSVAVPFAWVLIDAPRSIVTSPDFTYCPADDNATLLASPSAPVVALLIGVPRNPPS